VRYGDVTDSPIELPLRESLCTQLKWLAERAAVILVDQLLPRVRRVIWQVVNITDNCEIKLVAAQEPQLFEQCGHNGVRGHPRLAFNVDHFEAEQCVLVAASLDVVPIQFVGSTIQHDVQNFHHPSGVNLWDTCRQGLRRVHGGNDLTKASLLLTIRKCTVLFFHFVGVLFE
jgi:hypothetical protein